MSLVHPARRSPWAAFGGSGAVVQPEQLWRDAGGPADGRARTRKAQGGRADAEARDCVRRCVAGSGAVQDAERAGGRGGQRRLLEGCGWVRSCAGGYSATRSCRGTARARSRWRGRGGGAAGPRDSSGAWRLQLVRRRPERRKATEVKPLRGTLEVCSCSPLASEEEPSEILRRAPLGAAT
ncbi:hypothetical protein NDU88_004512 [Pleurodeles waltl]|uniref:Uncharacterized protein n=1 Tax=Pleurodeles waltl TaxID=8319 RepID=A0AAV7SJ00_PLEWA|nr:hypothetical protein NDU88_004512 [Pleurodeles waltl]